MEGSQSRPTIRGDRLLLGLQYLEYLAQIHADPESHGLPFDGRSFIRCQRAIEMLDQKLEARHACWYWYGKIAHALPVRPVLQSQMASIQDAAFYVDEILRGTIYSTRFCGPLDRFFLALALGEIAEQDLLAY